MTTPDPTPTPAAPDSLRAALERLLKLRDNDTHALLGLDWHEAFEVARDAQARAALAQPDRTGDHISRLEAELERERLRLAACGVVAMADTPESAAKARDMHPDCWSASLDDVIRQVDALMAARAALATTPPAPTPATPDWRELCAVLLEAIDEDVIDCNDGPRFQAVVDRVRAALATAASAPPLEPRGCPTPGACSCPTTPIVPQELIRALELAEAALADIGDADREPGDDQPWAEHRAALDLPKVRHALQTWREHATPPAPTREAAPVPQQRAEITREQAVALYSEVMAVHACQTLGDMAEQFARAVWARAQGASPGAEVVAEISDEELLRTYGLAKRNHCYEGPIDDWPKRAERAATVCGLRAVLARYARPAIQPVPVSERLPGPEDCDETGFCWGLGLSGNWMRVYIPGRYWDDPGFTHWLPHRALPLPATAQQEPPSNA